MVNSRVILPFSIALLYESCFLKEPLVTEVLDVLGEILGDDLAEDFSMAS